MSDLKFTDTIEWPNGEGFTPCTREYAETMDARDAIFDPNIDKGSSENLAPDLYQRYCELDNKLATLQADGHIGKSVRY